MIVCGTRLSVVVVGLLCMVAGTSGLYSMSVLGDDSSSKSIGCDESIAGSIWISISAEMLGCNMKLGNARMVLPASA